MQLHRSAFLGALAVSFALAALCSTPFSVLAKSDTPAASVMKVGFQGLSFGEDSSTVTKRLSKYRLTSKLDTQLNFSGVFSGEQATIRADFTPKSKVLYKVTVSFENRRDISPDVYFKIKKDNISEKYGHPAAVIDFDIPMQAIWSLSDGMIQLQADHLSHEISYSKKETNELFNKEHESSTSEDL